MQLEYLNVFFKLIGGAPGLVDHKNIGLIPTVELSLMRSHNIIFSYRLKKKYSRIIFKNSPNQGLRL